MALQKAGIEVVPGVLEAEAKKLNEAFIKFIKTGIPFVTLKVAQTLDGKIATSSGESKWITGGASREAGHRLRDSNDAILVGINTVLKDDPSLTARIPRGRDPVRVIVDSNLRIPMQAKVINQRSSARTIVATLAAASRAKAERLRDAGVEVLFVRSARGRVNLSDLLARLGAQGFMSVLIEGGAEVNASAISSGIVDKVVFFIAPTLMTGRDSLCSIGGVSPLKLGGAKKLHDVTVEFAGMDLKVTGYLGTAREK